jgi:hypothetical protein
MRMFENLADHANHASLLHRDMDCSGNDTIYSTWHTDFTRNSDQSFQIFGLRISKPRKIWFYKNAEKISKLAPRHLV